MALAEHNVIAKDRIFDHCEYYPHDGQWKIHNSVARHRVASCGRRFGKSKSGGHELVPEAVMAYSLLPYLQHTGDQRYFWITGPNYSDAEKEFRVVYNALKRLEMPFDKPGTYYDPIGGNMKISLWDGKFIVECRSGAHPDSLVGEGLSGALLVEAAKMKSNIWSKYIRPALADKRGWSLHTSTPEGKNHFYELWQKGQDPNNRNWESWRMPSWSNDIIFPGGRTDPEILDMEADMTEERFAQEVAADFTEFVGRVFKDFDEEIHVADLAYDPRYPVYGAIDYGWTNPFVWLVVQVDAWDNVYVLGEYRAIHTDINDIARDLAAFPLIREKTKKMFPDPAEPGDTAVLNKALRIPAAGDTGGELKWRLELIRQHLKLYPEHIPTEERKPKLYIDRSCKELIREMQDYRYPENKSELRSDKEEPMDKDNHGPEALGRFMRGYFGPPGAEGKQNARVRKANLGGRR